MNRPFPKPAFELDARQQPHREELTLGDGYVTSVYVHDEPAGVSADIPVVYMHGIQSHPGWFYRSARTLADAGHRVFQVTRRGSGDNSIKRGHCKNPRQLFDDIDCAIDFALKTTGKGKAILLGVSWGGKLICAYALSDAARRQKTAKLVLIAPGLFSLIDVPAAKKLAIAACLMTGLRKTTFNIPLGDAELFTANPAMQKYLLDDEFQLHGATAKFMFTSRLLDLAIRKASAGSLDIPVDTILSSNDRIIDNAATRRWLCRVCGSENNIRTLRGEHTLEFESNATEFLQAATDACRTKNPEKS
ncbi:MAG TPA: alpha/beta fold hydrolase [Phycisphaerae bacterium]|nr:alpha/beta fold hydrolase [Phycisphaerae bacterium]HPS53189.1 alpha/beta fold hydrolase [Phycisphaerae bacterium]